MLAFWGLHFNHTWDLTAAGTLLLALVTLAAVIVAAIALWQTRADIALSRKEVEEAHRPVLVPLADHRKMEFAGPGLPASSAAKPDMHIKGLLTVPIENIGPGPALRVEATVELLNEDGGPSVAGGGGQTPGTVMGLKASGSVSVDIAIRGLTGIPGFWLTLTYEDVAGKAWITKARYMPSRDRYADLTFNTQAEGAYGLKQDTELVKPVPPGW
jgi:hypothetical protein